MRDYSKGILVAGFSKEALNCASKLVANCVENLRGFSALLQGSDVYLITDNCHTIDGIGVSFKLNFLEPSEFDQFQLKN